jgi:hypothetical protein
MKSFLCATVLTVLIIMVVIQPVFGQDMYKSQDQQRPTTRGDAVILDLVLLRPFGLIASALGLVTSVAATPFALISHSEGETYRALVVEPLGYTFKRPLGDLDNDYQQKRPASD